jgi:hypothetical protein
MIKRVLSTLFILASLFAPIQTGHAQASLQIEEVQISYEYGAQITFAARFSPTSNVQEAYLFFQAEGDSEAHSSFLALSQDGQSLYRYEVNTGLIRPFARVFFWYRVALVDGGVFDSPRYFFQYDDNRYPWQILEDERIRVHWYAGEPDFGQQAFDAAHVGLQSLENLIPVDPGSLPVDIFVYATGQDIEDTLRLGGYAWDMGHVNPELGVVLVAVSPDENASSGLSSQIPHELAHAVLYRMSGSASASLPVWLSEGIASLAENGGVAGISQEMIAANGNDTLLTMEALCAAFPTDVSNAALAYAQAASFTQYLREQYGPGGLLSLIESYAQGRTCEKGARHALNQPLSQLDRHWRQAVLGEAASPVALANLLPYTAIILLVFLFPLASLLISLRKKKESKKHAE